MIFVPIMILFAYIQGFLISVVWIPFFGMIKSRLVYEFIRLCIVYITRKILE